MYDMKKSKFPSLKLIVARIVGNMCHADDLNYLPEELSCFVRNHMTKTRQIELWDGQVLKYYSNMQLADEYNYNKNGELHGKRISWRRNGEPWREETYMDGKLHGPMLSYHWNGRLAQCCFWKKGRRKKCHHWLENGKSF